MKGGRLPNSARHVYGLCSCCNPRYKDKVCHTVAKCTVSRPNLLLWCFRSPWMSPDSSVKSFSCTAAAAPNQNNNYCQTAAGPNGTVVSSAQPTTQTLKVFFFAVENEYITISAI